MAPQPVPQQPVGMTFDQIGPLLALMNNKKGSLNADISTLFDPQFGFMSGSYNQTSPEELDSLYAPQTNAVRNSGDSNLLSILGAMENGKSAFQIQQSINQKIVDGSLPADPDGTGKSYLDLVDTLFKEQQTVKEKMFDQNKIFTNAGLSTPDQRFDPQTYMPEAFKAIDERVAANRPKVDAALAAIKSKYDSMPPPAANPSIRTKEQESALRTTGSQFGLSPKQILAQDGPQAVAAYKTYLKRVEQNPPKSQTEIENSAIRRTGSQFGLSPKQILAQDGPQAKAAYKTYLKRIEEDKPKVNTNIPSREQQIRDSNRQLEIERAGGKAKQIISPNSTNQQPVYNPYDEEATAERMKQLIAQKISEGLVQRGEIPTNVELLQRVLLNKNSKG
jgi:hypothetical protein